MECPYLNDLFSRFDSALSSQIGALKPEDSQTFFKLQTARNTLVDLKSTMKADIVNGDRANKELIGESKPKRRT